MRRGIVLLLTTMTMTLLTAACAPKIAPPGLFATAPRLTGDAFITRDGLILPVRRWAPAADAPPQAVILALHGFNDYANAFKDTGPWLAERGVLVYAYDQRGFGATANRGLWAGTAAMTGDVADFARALKALHPRAPLFLLGESMGGAVLMVAATGDDPPPRDGLILAAPAVWGRAAMPWYQRWALTATAHTLPWLRLSGRGLKIKPSNNIEMLRALGRDPLVIKETRVDTLHGLVGLMDEALAAAPRLSGRVLLQYGARDEIIPKPPTLNAIAALPGCAAEQRVAVYDGGYHMLYRDLDGTAFLQDVIAWIATPDAPLPSGADRLAEGGGSPRWGDALLSLRARTPCR